jgi:peroxygenase
MQQNATSSKLDIYVEDIYKGKHGSDSGSYDAEGRWVMDSSDGHL